MFHHRMIPSFYSGRCQFWFLSLCLSFSRRLQFTQRSQLLVQFHTQETTKSDIGICVDEYLRRCMGRITYLLEEVTTMESCSRKGSAVLPRGTNHDGVMSSTVPLQSDLILNHSQ
ncbi:hypothetical protein PFISCL1PPCAC_6234 [Pristionchus fissidentatus]|uniref:Uncharacterized protein n=1 Tax=Pristionchus fissidentatus TaxID=1538716 RepID=A0AAV5V9M1_9BILA|nr:hypothetical protein PFISCL1PPCAC_6234 [Pristionchus fissidentatus]